MVIYIIVIVSVVSKDYRVKFSVSTQELGSLFGPKAWERMIGG